LRIEYFTRLLKKSFFVDCAVFTLSNLVNKKFRHTKHHLSQTCKPKERLKNGEQSEFSDFALSDSYSILAAVCTSEHGERRLSSKLKFKVSKINQSTFNSFNTRITNVCQLRWIFARTFNTT
jgi:hypothetical protein